ncbi:Signal transduction histidine kinase [Microbacterium enclense]|uniref:histidine kinase n=2 Tax=Microbacterium enclense TaxID=993073 RepID=A0A1G6JIJ5_9MICO|nr:hypothetical protein AS029_07890 [Microbacterium enclense]SDC18612.1 Signal transduction histidine kinase [Microbacterium enclense]
MNGIAARALAPTASLLTSALILLLMWSNSEHIDANALVFQVIAGIITSFLLLLRSHGRWLGILAIALLFTLTPTAWPAYWAVVYGEARADRQRLAGALVLLALGGSVFCAFEVVAPVLPLTFTPWVVSLSILGGMTSVGAALAGRSNGIAARRELLSEAQAALADESAERARDAARSGEQQRLSRELHDLLGHRLAALNLLVKAQVRTDRPDELLWLMQSQISQARAELEELVDLRGTPTSKEAPTLNELLESFRMLDIDVRSEVDALYESLPGAHRLLVDRFVRESITNAVKYAAPGPIWVSVRITESALDVQCTSLMGEAPVSNERSEHAAGLTGLNDRASLLGGHVSWSRSEHGFTTHLHVPV